MKSDLYNEVMVMASLVGTQAATSSPDGQELPRMDSASDVRDILCAHMDNTRSAAILAGMDSELVEVADFAVCAYVDEIILSLPAWQGQKEWMKKPLQFIRHGTATAGEGFYTILDSLLEEMGNSLPLTTLQEHEDEQSRHAQLTTVLEIFALCLMQGFSGMLYGNVKAIQDKLSAIAHYVPSIRKNIDSLFLIDTQPMEITLPKKAHNYFSRFDMLDWCLWLIPCIVTAALYLYYKSALNKILESFIQAAA